MRPGCWFTLLLVLSFSVLKGQDATLVPALLKQLKGLDNDSARAKLLSDISFNLVNSEKESAMMMGQEALKLGTAIGNPSLRAGAHNALGWLYAQHGPLDKAELHLDSALLLFREAGSLHDEAVVLNNQGWMYEKRGDLVSALSNFHSAFRILEQEADSGAMAVNLYSIGSLHNKLEEHQDARSYFEQALDFEQLLGRKSKQATCVLGLANSYNRSGDHQKATEYYERALVLYQELKDLFGQGLVAENLGNLHFEHAPERAIAYYDQAMVFYDSLQSDLDRAYVFYGIGKSAMKLQQLERAETNLREGARLAGEVGNLDLYMQQHYALAELFSMLGESDSTLVHFQLYENIKDSLQGENAQRELVRLKTEFETERKEKDNELLRAKNSEQKERLKVRGIQLYGSIALGFLAMVAAMLFWRNLRNKRRHVEVLDQLNQRLANSNEEIKEINGLLEMKVLRGQMNPHFIYNCLNSAAQLTQAGKGIEALAYLQGFSRLLRMVLDHSVKDMVELEEEMTFLRLYLKLEAQRLEGLNVSVECPDDLLDQQIPALLVQPFVENAIWHGLAPKDGSRELKVEFTEGENGLTCTINDNGVGRGQAAANSNADHNSLGMQLTSERLRLLAKRMAERASFTVLDLENDGKAMGTKVVLHLPSGG